MEPNKIPHNPDSESIVCGGIIQRGARMLADIGDLLRPEHCYMPPYEAIFAAAQEADAAGQPVDYATIAYQLRQSQRFGKLAAYGGDRLLTDLSRRMVTAEQVIHHAGVVRALAVRREVIQAAADIIEAGYRHTDPNDFRSFAVERITAAGGDIGRTRAKTLRELLKDAHQRMEQRFNRGTAIRGVPTGFSGVDAILSGLQNQRLYILAARPSMGKTALAMQLAIQGGVPTYVASLEMGGEDLVDRSLIQDMPADSERFAAAQLTQAEWTRLSAATERLAHLPVQIDACAGANLAELRAKLRRWRAKTPGQVLVVVDYLQLIAPAQGRRDNREQEVSLIARGLKGLASELDLPVLALSQLSRECEKRPDKRPGMADLRESGEIEQAADVVAFLYRDEVYHRKDLDPDRDRETIAEQAQFKGVAEVIIGKNRHGRSGVTVRLAFKGDSMRFDNLAPVWRAQ